MTDILERVSEVVKHHGAATMVSMELMYSIRQEIKALREEVELKKKQIDRLKQICIAKEAVIEETEKANLKLQDNLDHLWNTSAYTYVDGDFGWFIHDKDWRKTMDMETEGC
jgi:hypothetical protein